MWPGPLDHHVKAELHRVHAVGDLPLLAPAHMVAMTNVGRTGTNHAPGPPRRAARMALVMMLLTQHFSIFHAQSTFDLQSMINYSCLQRLSLQTLGTAMCRRVEPRDHQHRYKQQFKAFHSAPSLIGRLAASDAAEAMRGMRCFVGTHCVQR